MTHRSCYLFLQLRVFLNSAEPARHQLRSLSAPGYEDVGVFRPLDLYKEVLFHLEPASAAASDFAATIEVFMYTDPTEFSSPKRTHEIQLKVLDIFSHCHQSLHRLSTVFFSGSLAGTDFFTSGP